MILYRFKKSIRRL